MMMMIIFILNFNLNFQTQSINKSIDWLLKDTQFRLYAYWFFIDLFETTIVNRLHSHLNQSISFKCVYVCDYKHCHKTKSKSIFVFVLKFSRIRISEKWNKKQRWFEEDDDERLFFWVNRFGSIFCFCFFVFIFLNINQSIDRLVNTICFCFRSFVNGFGSSNVYRIRMPKKK